MPLTTYADAEAFLNSQVNYECMLGSPELRYDTRDFDLAQFRARLAALGDPHLKYAVIHVAGTKGKGSTCAFCASILKEAGLKVGLYTSPHIERYTERIRISGEEIPDAKFCELLERLSSTVFSSSSTSEVSSSASSRLCGGGSSNHSAEGGTTTQNSELKTQNSANAGFRTVFELLTAAAFLYFAEEKVDVAVIETGLGGRLDATNVFDRPGAGPLITVITAIGLDHTAILGDTIEKIAAEKAGIIRPHGTLIIAHQHSKWWKEVFETIYSQAEKVGCSRVREVYTTQWGLDRSMDGGLKLQMKGEHQLRNVETAWAVIYQLSLVWNNPNYGTMKLLGAIRAGVEKAYLPGRFEVLYSDPLIIIDGAHDALSGAALAQTFNDLYGPDRRAVLVVGFLRDKAAAEILRAAAPLVARADAIICCTPPTPRARPATETAEAVHQLFSGTVETIDDPAAACARALELRHGDAAVVSFGSMYLIGPATRAFRELVKS